MHISTSRRMLGMPVVLLAAAMAVACVSAVPNHARATTERTYFPQFGVSIHAYRPHRLNPSADGSLFIRHVHWTVWNNRRAVGHGIAHVNDCKPYCAVGHYTKHRVTVRLTRPRVRCGSRFFMAIRLRGPSYRTYAQWPGIGCTPARSQATGT